MKLRKILSLIVITALVMTCTGIVFTPAAYAATNGTTFTENFDNMTLGDTYENTLQALVDDGWQVVTNNGYMRNPVSTLGNASFVQVVNQGGRKCLQIITPGGKANNYKYGLGRLFPGQTGVHTDGIWEINFKFKPYASGSTKAQFNFSLNTYNAEIDETVAQHNIISAYNNKMYMGYRNYLSLYEGAGVPQGRIEGSALVLDWYDVKVILNCDDRYYSVELSRNGNLVARRSPISFDGTETIGFFKLSALGMSQATTVFVDDIEIKRAARETLIYEDDFEAYSSVVETSDGMTTGGETEVYTGHSYFEGCTPWRANDDVGKSYGLDIDVDLMSQVVRLGDDDSTSGTTEASGLVYMLAYEKLVDQTTESHRGMVKTSFKFKPSAIGASGASVNVISDYTEDINASAAEIFKLVDNNGTPALLNASGEPVNLDDSLWYEAELVFDVLNNEVTTAVKDLDTSAEVAGYTQNVSSLTALNAIMFKAAGGSVFLMDDVKIEYYMPDPSIDASGIVLTDKYGETVSGTTNVPVALDTIKIPVGCVLDNNTASASTIKLRDGNGTEVSYGPSRAGKAYTLILNETLAPSTTYTVTVPSTLANVFGVQLGSDFTYTFTTSADVPKLMDISAVKTGGAEISSLSDITAGSTINVEVAYANSTADAITGTVIVVFYGGSKIVDAVSGNTTVAAGAFGKDTTTFALTVPSGIDMTEVDSVSVLLWDGFANITPYCPAVIFD